MHSFKIPIRIVSESNINDHWTDKHKRKKIQKTLIKWALRSQLKPNLPVVVTITRITPRALDFDNLHGGMKTAIDTIADWLIPGLAPGRADGDPRLEFKLEQRKGPPKEYSIEVSFSEKD